MMESPGRYRDKSPIRKDNSRPSSSASPYRDRENSSREATPQHTHSKDMAVDQFWDGVVDIPNCDWLYTMEELKRKTPSRTSVPFEEEIRRRSRGIAFIVKCCRELRLSRSIGFTASEPGICMCHHCQQAEDCRRQDQQALLALEGQAHQVRGEAVRGAVLRSARGQSVQVLHRGSSSGAPRNQAAVQ
ncbi:hypothetical protein B5S28_g3279 [[Candida] boidinii]|nr:hypothetical protein B5S28_g3279 [[Candida] boidinii]OWB63148.1 hypothetical protein B5S29_g4105 [[Candida] boidinii]OWB74204.1 hypothetical protein B5S31_g3987 [[Candida] boidinii]OWB80241.1 hypothetical protein B5S32_g4501 [[Candida] boidinii]